MKTKEDFFDMVNKRSSLVKDNQSDCSGTALYLTGEVSEDVAIKKPEKYLKNLKKTEFPEKGYLIEWEDKKGEGYHLAVINTTNPQTLLTRNGKNSKFFKDQHFDRTDYLYNELAQDLGIIKAKNNFYIPSKLQRILDSEK